MFVAVFRYAYLEQMIGTSFMYRRGSRFPQNRQRQYMQPSQEDDEGFYQYHCRVGVGVDVSFHTLMHMYGRCVL